MEIETFLRKYSKESLLFFSSAVVSYFLVYKTNLTPPVKPKEFVFSMSLLLEVVALLAVIGNRRVRKPNLRFVLGVIVVYFVALFSLTFPVMTSAQNYRDARGLVCNDNYLSVHPERCPFVFEQTALADVSYEPEKIWEGWSIFAVRSVLTALWLALVYLTVSAIARTVGRAPAKPEKPAGQ